MWLFIQVCIYVFDALICLAASTMCGVDLVWLGTILDWVVLDWISWLNTRRYTNAILFMIGLIDWILCDLSIYLCTCIHVCTQNLLLDRK